MKTSIKILLTTAVVTAVFLIIGMVVLRKEVNVLIARNNAEFNYQNIETDSFNILRFSHNWKVNIRQGKDYIVEVAMKNISPEDIEIENIQGTLYFNAKTNTHKNINVKITVPSLQAINAEGGSEVQLNKFKADSLSITLYDSVTFTGYKNQIEDASFKTSGKVRLNISDHIEM